MFHSLQSHSAGGLMIVIKRELTLNNQQLNFLV